MRTLLNEPLPPNYRNESTFSPPEPIKRSGRIFSQNAVLPTNTADLTEVGADGTVMATPGAGADAVQNAPGRGMAPADRGAEQPESHSV
jgi:hypothetical protein